MHDRAFISLVSGLCNLHELDLAKTRITDIGAGMLKGVFLSNSVNYMLQILLSFVKLDYVCCIRRDRLDIDFIW